MGIHQHIVGVNVSEPLRFNSVHRDCFSRDVLKHIFAIHFPGSVEIADLTWGKGAFWQEPLRSQVTHKFDTNPRNGAVYGDCRKVLLPDNSVDVVVFDPPHQHGQSKTTTLKHQADYARLFNQAEGHQLILDTAAELRRIARQGAIIKVTDMVEAGRFMPTHALIMIGCSNILGWPCDLVILDSGVVRPMKPNQRVLHFRHAHSYFLIYKWCENHSPRSPIIKRVCHE